MVRLEPAGDVAAGGPWLPAYTAGLFWSVAWAACRLRDKDLCTESQWHRPYSLDPEIGKAASWTVGARNGTEFVVLGGSSCNSARLVAGSQTDPARIGLCCSRAIAIQTMNRNASFLRIVSEKLLSFERAINAHSVPTVGELLDDTVTLYSLTNLPKPAAEKRFEAAFRQYPQETSVHGTCQVTLELVGSVWRDKWIGECDKAVDRGAEVAAVVSRYEFGGPKGKLRLIKEPRIVRNWSPP